MESEVTRTIERYGLDHFRIDYNTTIGEGENRVRDGIVENTIWRQVEAIWAMFARLRQRFPNVLFENCAGGGGRLDLGMLRYFQITEISDWMRAPRSLKIFNNVTLSLPLFEPSPWCVLEYAGADESRAVGGVFRLTGPADGAYRFRPRGLAASGRYQVTFDNTSDTVEVSGWELQRDGIEVRLASPLTSELVFFDRV
jgi:hypothetical protein